MPAFYASISLFRESPNKYGGRGTFRKSLKRDPEDRSLWEDRQEWLYQLLDPHKPSFSSCVTVMEYDNLGFGYKIAASSRDEDTVQESLCKRCTTDWVEEGELPRIIHFEFLDTHANPVDLDELMSILGLDKGFLLGHFLPTLPCEKKVDSDGGSANTVQDGVKLSWVAEIPSQHYYFRLKDFLGNTTSVAFVRRRYTENDADRIYYEDDVTDSDSDISDITGKPV